MVNNITVAWAIPVNITILGARLEAYVKSKSTVTAFRACIQHGQIEGTALGRLPPELIEIVAANIQQPIFEEHLMQWEKATECCLSECCASSHYTREEIMDIECSCDCREYDSELEDDHVEEWLMEDGEWYEKHSDIVRDHLIKIDCGCNPGGDGETEFMKCRKIFAQDFSLEVYFTVFRKYLGEDHFPDSPEITVLAYLILPSAHSAIKTSSGPDVVSFLASMIIDPLTIQEPSFEQKARFKLAMNALQLTPFVHKTLLRPSQPTLECLPTKDGLKQGKGVDFQIEKMKEQKKKISGTRVSNVKLGIETDCKEMASTQWPKLMMIGSGICEAEPGGYY